MDSFTGVGVALVTLLDDGGDVDTAATGALAADLVSRGMKAVLACGTTGEPDTLTDAERLDVIRAVRDSVPPGVPVLAGTGATSLARAAELTAAAAAAGAAPAPASPPAPPHDPRGVPARGSAARAGGRPGRPSHSRWFPSPGAPVRARAGLPVAGLKDSSGDPDRLLAEVAHYPGRTYVGSSALLALAGPIGGTGAILAAANAEPELCCAAFAGAAAAQRQLTDVHLALREGGVPALKRILAERRGTVALSRPPAR